MAARTGGGTSASADLLVPRILLIVSSLALTLIGCVMIYSSSSVSIISDAVNAGGSVADANPAEYLFDQVKFVVAGCVLAFLLWRFVPATAWRTRWVYAAWGLGIVLLALTAVMGTSALGATRWLNLGFMSLQPSEFAKISLVLMAAYLLDGLREGQFDLRQFVARVAVLVVVPLGFLYVTQSDLGTSIIIAVGIFAVAWLGEVPRKFIGIGFAMCVVVALVAIFGTGYRTDRLVVYDPWNDGEGGMGSGYQTIHSFYAFAEGGLFGVGLGGSREKFDYLPEAETDFVFSIIGEELGMVGALVVIGLFLVLLYAGLRIARAANSSFEAMIAGSLAVMIVFQAFLNIGCVIGLVPTTGKPLPFVSSGGSSYIATAIMIGLILSVSRGPERDDVYAARRANLRVVRAEGGGAHGGGAPRASERSRGRGLDVHAAPASSRRGREASSRGAGARMRPPRAAGRTRR